MYCATGWSNVGWPSPPGSPLYMVGLLLCSWFCVAGWVLLINVFSVTIFLKHLSDSQESCPWCARAPKSPWSKPFACTGGGQSKVHLVLGEICASKYQKKIDKSVQGSAGVAGGEGGEGGPPGQGSQVTCHLVLLPSPSSTSSSPLPPSPRGLQAKKIMLFSKTQKKFNFEFEIAQNSKDDPVWARACLRTL